MKLRRGKTKLTLEAAIDAALLAVEIYNKPRTSFRSEGYISMMIIAWTRLFHAYFNNAIGDRYYHKMKNGHYELIDGEKRSWELAMCIKKYNALPPADKALPEGVEKNLFFFIKLRNKIEHRHIDKREVDTLIFGECQALLFNFESLLIELFGNQYSINESLVYSLQFSQLRTSQQEKASKSALSRDLADVVSYVSKFRQSLDDDTFNSQEFSIKLLQLPKISNTNRADAAIEFVRWDALSMEDKESYQKVAALIKNKKVKVEGANVDRLKPSAVVAKVKEKLPEGHSFTQNLHSALFKVFSIRPQAGADDPFDTKTEFCLYDETHEDYVYFDAWVEFLIHFLLGGFYSKSELLKFGREGIVLKMDDFY